MSAATRTHIRRGFLRLIGHTVNRVTVPLAKAGGPARRS